jgi:hypothetical protein
LVHDITKAASGVVDISNGFYARNAAEVIALGMDGPDFPGETQFPCAPYGDVTFATANESDGLGIEEGSQAASQDHPPNGRNSAREMM